MVCALSGSAEWEYNLANIFSQLGDRAARRVQRMRVLVMIASQAASHGGAVETPYATGATEA